MKKTIIYAAVVTAIASTHTQLAKAAENNSAEDAEAKKIIVTGTRVSGRTIEDTAVPVDIITNEIIEESGASEVGELLQKLAPSFNFSRTTVSDGTDIIRPATLRGLGPDQVLILVNGKRRHSQAWVNIQQTIGRGSAGTDINSIPVSAIEHIEVLRDGAAAQYGSDAIAGVINIILKGGSAGTSLSGKWGKTKEGDGEVKQVSANSTVELGDTGFLNLTAEFRDRGATNRAGISNRKDRVIMRLGDSSSKNKYLFFNGEAGLTYFFGGVSSRTGESGGFYRFEDRADRNVPQVYPDGFLPLQNTEVDDTSLAFGVRDFIGESWEYDLSAVYGKNEFGFAASNSINASIAAEYLFNNPGATDADIAANSGPTSADSGGIKFTQLTYNFDLSSPLDWGLYNDVYFSTGLEYREEEYGINAGELASYSCGYTGSTNNPFPSVIDPSVAAACGMQGFPGYSPEIAASSQRERDNYAFYVDLETNLTDDFLLGIAARYEDFSDAGDTTTGKISARWDITGSFGLRGAVSTGFRAPSLAQRAFTTVFTDVDGTELSQTFHAPEGSEFAAAYGVEQLEHESSENASIGMVYSPGDGLSISLDAYQIDIEDRIVLGGGLNGQDLDANGDPVINQTALDFLNANGYNKGQFFSNAIDTETFGADLVLTYDWGTDAWGDFTFTWLTHYNRTEIKEINAPEGVLPETLFSQAQVDNVETGQPRQRLLLGLDWDINDWSTSLKINRYGKVKTSFFTCQGLGIPTENPDVCNGDLGIDPSPAVRSSAKWLADLEFRYNFDNGVMFTIGGNNITDEYPDKLPQNSAHRFISDAPEFGNYIYPWESTPFGINGAFYYIKLDYSPE
ncbi:TonB-dependent receptor plug domain-containing protein [Kangiella sediminilitoris]|uniref:Ferrienterobactin receptor n=1 Tax=Kangiella sediminilitoris TaxID=1144748 RepID=A0A1B3B8N6_9GAMM|nr:TonB-dependent receptor [Kangiella sediminilitoris]AOE49145.1 Ferrienterobactin receptor [Kangiella sediminilitoris]